MICNRRMRMQQFLWFGIMSENLHTYVPVSYTHLDVYKRQDLWANSDVPDGKNKLPISLPLLYLIKMKIN